MKLILDACVALKAILINEESADLALALLDDARQHVYELIAPDTLPIEMSHALTRAERQGILHPGQSAVLFSQFLNDCPVLYPYGDLLDRAMQLSSEQRIGVFDCLYVALAEEEQCQVVSVDQKLIKLFPVQVIDLRAL